MTDSADLAAALGYCWDAHDGLRCTLAPRHDGDHDDPYTRTTWPQRTATDTPRAEGQPTSRT